jgi:hypothetical protein
MLKFFKSKYGDIRGASRKSLLVIGGVFIVAVVLITVAMSGSRVLVISNEPATSTADSSGTLTLSPINTSTYNQKLDSLANNSSTTGATSTTVITDVATGTAIRASSTGVAPLPRSIANLWPVKTAPVPGPGALLPFNRIVAYYGNFYSTQMGVLGEYSTSTVLAKLEGEVKNWQAADPSTPVIPAIEYIDVTAQGSPGKDGKYRLRMPDSQIDKALAMAAQVNGIVILDLQVGQSDVQSELPLLDNYLKMPQVEIALDPEFSMKYGNVPGTVIGTMDATDINYTANYLAAIVKANNIPPKILVVHRFTENMVTNYKKITPLPEVEIVMDMDGWGSQAKKIGTYNSVIAPEPVQFTGFKLFYKNDLLPPSTGMLTPAQILKLTPQPIFIQYE